MNGGIYGQASGLPTSQGLPIGSIIPISPMNNPYVFPNLVTAPDGSNYLKTGVIANASQYPAAQSGPYVLKGPDFNIVTPNLVSGGLNAPGPYLVYGNGLAVSVDNNGNVQYSADGATWSTVALPNQLATGAICFGNGTFVVVGTGYTWYSTDAVNWTRVAATKPYPGSSVAYGAGLFVSTFGGGNAFVQTSPDGINWTPRAIPSAVMNTPCIAWNGARFAMLDCGGSTASAVTFYSTDGISWTQGAITAPTNNFNNVAATAGMFVAMSASETAFNTSPDGITWTRRTTTSPINSSNLVSYANGKFRTNNGVVSYTSTDGITWASSASSVSLGGASGTIIWNGTYYIDAMTNNGSAFRYSITGTTYASAGALALANTFPSMAYGSGYFISATGNSGVVCFSADGLGWVGSYVANAAVGSVAYFNSKWWAATASNIYSTPDRGTWTGASGATLYNGLLQAANDRLFSSGSGSQSNINYTTDGTTWNLTTGISTPETWAGALYGNGIYLLYGTGSNSTVSVSANGVAFSANSKPAAFGANSLLGMTFANGYFIASLSNNGSPSVTNIVISADGSTWVATTPTYCSNATFQGGRVYATGGLVLCPGGNWISVGGNKFYSRSFGLASTGVMVPLTSGGFVWIQNATTAAYVTSTPAKVLNDVAYKTYHASTELQLPLYQKVS